MEQTNDSCEVHRNFVVDRKELVIIMTPATNKKKKKAYGEFVWVMEGKTEYFAQLVDPVSMAERKGQDDQNIRVEVQWTHNRLFQWVALDQIRIELSPTGNSLLSSRTKTQSKSPPVSRKRSTPSPPKRLASSPKKKGPIPQEKKRQDKILENGKDDSPNVATKNENDERTTQELLIKKQKGASLQNSAGVNGHFDSLTLKKTDVQNSLDSFQAKTQSKSPSASRKRAIPSSLEKVASKDEKLEHVKEDQPIVVEKKIDHKRTNPEPLTKKQKCVSDQNSSGSNGIFASLTQQITDAKNSLVLGFQEIYKELVGSTS